MTFINMESMNNNEELNFDALNTVNGGNFFADLEEVLRRICEDDAKSTKEPLTGRGKC